MKKDIATWTRAKQGQGLWKVGSIRTSQDCELIVFYLQLGHFVHDLICGLLIIDALIAQWFRVMVCLHYLNMYALGMNFFST